MEFNEEIFNDARDGKLYGLKLNLELSQYETSSSAVSSYTNGTTPLVIACSNGHLDVAQYLIKRWNVSVEKTGLITLNGKPKNVTPIWCAASAGHLNIVKLLVKYNASINSTSDNMSVLSAACFEGHLEIVKYLVQHGANIETSTKCGNTCVMIACHTGDNGILKYLLNSGARINRKNLEGSTALHISIKSGYIDIVKLLLQSGAKLDSDSCGTTPLLLAALNGHSEIVDYFMNKFSCTKQEKVNALELLGATFMDKKHESEMFTHDMAIKYWKFAMEMCCIEDGEPPLKKRNTRSPLTDYINATEVHTVYDLEKMISDPQKMKIQSLLIRDRVLGQSHPANINEITACDSLFNITISIKLGLYALDVVLQEPFSEMIYNMLFNLTEKFSLLMTANILQVAVPLPPISFKDILHLFQRCVKEFERYLKVSEIQKNINDKNHLNDALIINMHLLFIMCKIQPDLNRDEDTELKKAAYKLVHLNPTTRNGWTPLHLVCVKDLSSLITYPTHRSLNKFGTFVFPAPEIVDLLLEVGACPNAVDLANNTPLHIIAANKPCAPSIFKALLNHGAHLDVCNYEKKTPLQLAETTPFLNVNPLHLDVYPLHYTNLKCICAKTIRKYDIAYQGLVHLDLKKFLDSH